MNLTIMLSPHLKLSDMNYHTIHHHTSAPIWCISLLVFFLQLFFFPINAHAFVGGTKDQCEKAYGTQKAQKQIDGEEVFVYLPEVKDLGGATVMVSFRDNIATRALYTIKEAKEFPSEVFSYIQKLNSKPNLHFNRAGYSPNHTDEIWSLEDTTIMLAKRTSSARIDVFSRDWVLRYAKDMLLQFPSPTPAAQSNKPTISQLVAAGVPESILTEIIMLPLLVEEAYKEQKKNLSGSTQEMVLAYNNISKLLLPRAATLKAHYDKTSYELAHENITRDQMAVSSEAFLARNAYGPGGTLAKVSSASAEVSYIENLIAYTVREILSKPDPGYLEKWTKEWKQAIDYKEPTE